MRKYLVVATILSLVSVAGALPTYTSTVANLGGGLYGHTFTVDNLGQPASAWFIEMEWWGATAAEVPSMPATLINQVLGMGAPVHEEAVADTAMLWDPSYSKVLDTWIMDEFGGSVMSTTEGANYYERQSATRPGFQYVTVDHAYIVSDGAVKFAGRLGVGLTNPTWTPVSGYSIPEPATMLLLGIGAMGLAIRKRR